MAQGYELDETVNDLLEDLEQDVIAELLPPEGVNRKRSYADGYENGWNDAMRWVLERLKTYRRD